MKKKINLKTNSFGLPFLGIQMILLAGSAMGQSAQLKTERRDTVYDSESGKMIEYVCGSYPSSGTILQSDFTLNTTNDCATIITPGAILVKFSSTKTIILKPGFLAQSGSYFIAYIDSMQEQKDNRYSFVNLNEGDEKLQNNQFESRETKETDVSQISMNVMPNPFHSDFEVKLNLSKDEEVKLTLYNATGLKIRELSAGQLLNGNNTLFFNCTDLTPGVYVIEINSKNSRALKRVVKI